VLSYNRVNLIKIMKKTMKSVILGFLVLTFALGFTSCGNNEDDPKPTDNATTINKFIGVWTSTQVVFNGRTFLTSTDRCNTAWTVSNFRGMILDINNGIFASNVTNLRCNEQPVLRNLTATYDSKTKILSFSTNFRLEVLEFTPNTMRARLLESPNPTIPTNGIYSFIKQ